MDRGVHGTALVWLALCYAFGVGFRVFMVHNGQGMHGINFFTIGIRWRLLRVHDGQGMYGTSLKWQVHVGGGSLQRIQGIFHGILQGYLAHKKPPPPKDRHRSLGMVLP